MMAEFEADYDLILLDVPPINIVSDPLALSDQVAGAVFVVRQHFSDHRELQKALKQTEMTGMNLLGFVFYGENLRRGGYYSRKYYYYNGYKYGKYGKYSHYSSRKKYDTRNRYDTRTRAVQDPQTPNQADTPNKEDLPQ